MGILLQPSLEDAVGRRDRGVNRHVARQGGDGYFPAKHRNWALRPCEEPSGLAEEVRLKSDRGERL